MDPHGMKFLECGCEMYIALMDVARSGPKKPGWLSSHWLAQPKNKKKPRSVQLKHRDQDPRDVAAASGGTGKQRDL